MHFLQGREHGVRIVFMNGPLESIIECIFNPIGVKHIKKGLMVSPVFCVPPHSRTITHWQFPMIVFGTTSPPDCGPAQTEPAGCLPLRPPSACHGAPGHCAGSWWTGCRQLEGKTCVHSARWIAQGLPSHQSAYLLPLAQTGASWSQTPDLCLSFFENQGNKIKPTRFGSTCSQLPTESIFETQN